MDYKIHHPPTGEGWADHLFAIFKNLDCPSEVEEEDEEEELEEQTGTVATAFHSLVGRIRSGSTLSLPEELAQKDVNPKRKASSEQGTPLAKKPKATSGQEDEEKDDDSEGLEIIEEIVLPHSPIQDPPPRGPPPTAMEKRVSGLEALITSMAKDVKSLTNRPKKQDSRVQHRDPRDIFEEDSEEESIDGSLSQKMNKKEKRELWLSSLRDINPELQHPIVTPSSMSSQHFSAFTPRQDKTIMPFCPQLSKEIEKAAGIQKTGAAKKDPFKTVNKFFKTMEPLESTLLQPRQIPMKLLSEVHFAKLQNPGASGVEARLKKNSPAGQKEVAALRDFNQAASSLRLINSQELGLEALNILTQKMSSTVAEMSTTPGMPQRLQTQMQALTAHMETASTAVEDLKLGNSHLARGAIHQYTEAIRDRQSAWVTSSNLPAPLQSEICKSALAIPEGTSTEPLSILGSQDEKLLDGFVTQRKDDVFRDWHKQRGKSTSNVKRQNKRQKKKWPAAQPPAQLTPQAQGAGWSTPFIPRGRGGGRGRAGGRGRGAGRGSQPFSGAESSTGNQ